jgi:hypothetical protein
MYSWPGDPGKNVRGVPRLEGNPLCFRGEEQTYGRAAPLAPDRDAGNDRSAY